MSDNEAIIGRVTATIVGAAVVIGALYALPWGSHQANVAQPAAAQSSPTPATPSTAGGATSPASGGASITTAGFSPPPESAIPKNQFGDMVRLGEAIFTDAQHNAAQYVGNDLQCANCHLDRGRLASSAPLWAAYVSYPAYRSKNGHVNTFEERLQGCFRFSMNGKAPPLGDKVLVALESYAYFLATNAPTGGLDHGYKKLSKPALAPDPTRGEKAYNDNCALCHQANGQGQSASDGQWVFPPLWGARSFNWGAGMSNINNAAAFIKANMPLSKGGSLTDQQAWDIAAYVDSHDRPQDPRFKGDVAQTRKAYHDSAMSMYGQSVDGEVLGANSPPSGPATP